MGIIKLILVIFVFVIIIGVAFVGMFIRSVWKIKKQFGNLGNNKTQNNDNIHNKSNKSEVKYTQNHNQKKKIFNENDGEYVDFEE